MHFSSGSLVASIVYPIIYTAQISIKSINILQFSTVECATLKAIINKLWPYILFKCDVLWLLYAKGLPSQTRPNLLAYPSWLHGETGDVCFMHSPQARQYRVVNVLCIIDIALLCGLCFLRLQSVVGSIYLFRTHISDCRWCLPSSSPINGLFLPIAGSVSVTLASRCNLLFRE